MSQPVINSRVNQLSVKTVSQAGRQVKEIGDATQPQDAVSLNQVTTVQTGLQSSIDTNTASLQAQITALQNQLNALVAQVNAPRGPGAGTYVVGLKLTGGGVNGEITLDAQAFPTAIQQAT